MKRLAVREFQAQAKYYMKNLPVILTKWNIPKAIIIEWSEKLEKKYGQKSNTK